MPQSNGAYRLSNPKVVSDQLIMLQKLTYENKTPETYWDSDAYYAKYEGHFRISGPCDKKVTERQRKCIKGYFLNN